MSNGHQELVGFIWNIANKLRGPYRPPQYRKVMLPMTVLRRLDSVIAPDKEKVLEEYKRLKALKLTGTGLETALARFAGGGKTQGIYNISNYTFQKLLDDPVDLAKNLIVYINGFSTQVKEIFENFKFEDEIQKLDKNNRLLLVMQEFTNIDLSPSNVSNLQMGYLFEELIRKFNESANEEAGDHFTPREVIRLMVHILYTGEEHLYKKGIARTIYDPACGTGGMLSVSEEYIRSHNDKANITLFGQEYNDESYAICTSDILIKGGNAENIAFGDTLGDGKTSDMHKDRKFHYMLANPPFGVEWKPEEEIVKAEYKKDGFSGRFGPGLPRINDGSLLFLLHMISKMHKPPEKGGDGSKIAVVFNGSPLFTGDAGSGESNIRRWILENDWLDAVVALPDQLFYNTGISTYIWFLSNKKPAERKGKVQLIDGTRFFKKMKKSLGNKRNEISEEQIGVITKLYAEYEHNKKLPFEIEGATEDRICSKILDIREFGYLKVTVERPLRLNFTANSERIAALKSDEKFQNYAPKKSGKAAQTGAETQKLILEALEALGDTVYKNRDDFITDLEVQLEEFEVKPDASLKTLVLKHLGERDETADICTDKKGNPEPDPDLRDTESIPFPDTITFPLPLDYDNETGLDELIPLVQAHCEQYMKDEVLPHVPDAWIDYSKTKVGYEIPMNRLFYVFKEPRDLKTIEQNIIKAKLEMDLIYKNLFKQQI